MNYTTERDQSYLIPFTRILGMDAVIGNKPAHAVLNTSSVNITMMECVNVLCVSVSRKTLSITTVNNNNIGHGIRKACHQTTHTPVSHTHWHFMCGFLLLLLWYWLVDQRYHR